ncbi:MAG: DUF6491 family protein [Caulobacterales bacterium]
MSEHHFKTKIRAALLTAMLAATTPNFAQAAPASKKHAPQCFNSASISGWNRIDDHIVRVHTGPSRDYDLTVMGTINDLAFRDHIGVQSGPSNWICTGNGLGVSVVTTGPFKNTYPVTNISAAPTKTAAHALRKKEKQASREDRVAAGPGAKAALAFVESSTPARDEDRSPGSTVDGPQ